MFSSSFVPTHRTNLHLIFSTMSSSRGSPKNTLIGFAPEIKGNIIKHLSSPSDVNNASRTKAFHNEARQAQFEVLDLKEKLEVKKLKVEDLIKQLRTPAQGRHPFGSYVLKLKYVHSEVNIGRNHLIAILKACDNLRDLEIRSFDHHKNINWAMVLRNKTNLRNVELGRSKYDRSDVYADSKYDFWSLFSTLTTALPKIEKIVLDSIIFTDSGQHSKTVTIPARMIPTGSGALTPCKHLQAVLSHDLVWTIPYLKYLTAKAPNLTSVQLRMRYEKRITDLTSTLETALKVWSRTLGVLALSYEGDRKHPEVEPHLLPLTFPKMEKLEELHLFGIKVSAASLKNLPSVKNLALQHTNDKDIADEFSNRSILPNLKELFVETDNFDPYENAAKKRRSHRLEIRERIMSGNRRLYYLHSLRVADNSVSD